MADVCHIYRQNISESRFTTLMLDKYLELAVMHFVVNAFSIV